MTVRIPRIKIRDKSGIGKNERIDGLKRETKGGITKRVRRFSFYILFLLVFIHPVPVLAEKSPGEYRTFTFYLENDVFTGTDREYTNGVKFTWISCDLDCYRDNPHIPEWGHRIIDHLPFVRKAGFKRNVSISIGQNMYAPEDLERTDLIPDQRPYAGITYLAFGFHSKSSRRMDTFEIDLGILGPHSYAEQVQKTWHRWIDTTRPKGWDHQLKDEPILNVFYERKWKVLQSRLGERFAYDFIPHLGCSLGNAFTGANFGGQFRFGWNLPNDFGTFLIRPGSDTNAPMDENDPRFFSAFQRFGVHVFLDVDGQGVLRDILLDGNTFRDSHSVDKKPFVIHFMMGVGILIHRYKISCAYVRQTREYDSQKDKQEFGAVTLSYSF
ncbi:MAG TPA: lipid A deacylase LpxR family protein [Desulfobacteraceae bacterium]|nr:lipid A deacylase LpxR family protein [Desulfobacteraceae bacterium]